MRRNLSNSDHLRTKYRPRMRMGTGIVCLAPWLDVILAGGLFLFAMRLVSVAPGLVLELPEAPFEAGLRTRHVMLVFAARPGGVGGDTAYLLDERFDLSNPERYKALAAALARLGGDETGVTIYADKGVRHGTVADLLSAARAAGFGTVNLATDMPTVDPSMLDGTGGMP